MRRPHLALSISAAALAVALPAAGLRAQTAPAKPAATANPMAASRGARSLMRNGADYLDYGEPERALELLREAEARQFELTAEERTQLNQAIVRARQAIRAGDAPGTKAPVTVRTTRSRRAGSIVLNTPPAMPPLPGAGSPAPEPIQLTSGERVEAPAPPPADAAAPAPLLTPTPELPPSGPDPSTPPSAARLADEVPPSLLAEPAPEPLAAPVERPVPTPAPLPRDERPAEMPELPTHVSAPPAPLRGTPAATAPVVAGDPPALGIESGDPLASDLPTPGPAEAPQPAPAIALEPALPELPVLPDASAATLPEPAPIPVDPTAAAAILPEPAPLPEPPPVEIATTPRGPDAPLQRTAGPGPEPFPDEPLPPPAEEIAAPQPAPREVSAPVAAPTLPPLPAGMAAAPTRTDLQPAARGVSLLSPETRRQVEEMARRQRMDMRGGSQSDREGMLGRGLPLTGGGLEGFGENRPSSAMGTFPEAPVGSAASAYDYGYGPGSGGQPAETRIELPRPPSPTEPRPIRSIPVPEEYVSHAGRTWAPSRKVWAAAATCHGPLYFQDAVLERYGQSVEQAMGPAGRFLSYPIDDPKESNLRMQIAQPFYSIGLFGAQVASWPVRMLLDPPWEAEYDLGYYRPGDRIPADTYYLPRHGYGPPLQGRNY